MKIEAGKYYRTRGEQIVGPMRRRDGTTPFPWGDGTDCWTDNGRFSEDVNNCDMDLISEVHVSDTPPAPQVNTAKTEKDELVEKAALAILAGREANPRPSFHYGMEDVWLAAKRFVEDGKK